MALALTSRRRAWAAAASALAAMALAAAVLGRGCDVAEPGPEAAVRSLVQAARANDRKAVWRLLSPATQRAIEAEAHKDLVRARTHYEALDLISIGSSDDVAPPTDFKLVSRHGDRALVEVSGPTGAGTIELVRIAGHWKIDLPDYAQAQ